MHIPDGFVGLPMALGFAVLSVAVLGGAARRADGHLDGPQAPLLGVTAAGIFAAQMLNWPLPLPGGTSAHFVGGAFAAIVLGPHLGALAVAAVVAVQALVFADGGIVALGLNTWNMAIVEVYVGYAVYRLLAGHNTVAAAFAAGWLASALGAVSVALQLGASPAFGIDLGFVLAVVGGSHLLLGLIEGAITAVVYRQIAATRPDVLVRPSWGIEA